MLLLESPELFRQLDFLGCMRPLYLRAFVVIFRVIVNVLLIDVQNLALNAAKSIGCQVVNIGAQDLIEGR